MMITVRIITGGGKHVHKLAQDSSEQKAFASISKLAYSSTGLYKVLFVGPGKIDDGWDVGRTLLLEIAWMSPDAG